MSIKTMKDVHDRCIDDGECWVWQQAVGSSGYPQAQVHGRGYLLLRRWIMEKKIGRPLERSEMVVSDCSNKLCCRSAHLFITSRSEVLREAWRDGSRKPVGLEANRAKAEKAGFVKLSRESVAEILSRLASGERTAVLAAEYGCTPANVRRIRAGQQWADKKLLKGASVFSWGGIAA